MKFDNSVLAIGNFDGFHMGHQTLVDRLMDIGRRKQRISIILSFTPNPKIYFKPGFPLINTCEQRKELLKGYGVDEVVFLEFKDIMRMSPGDFIKHILIDRFGVRDLIVGYDFRFGLARAGDVKLLKEFARKFGFKLHIIPPVVLEKLRVSSTVIRDKIARGEFDRALRDMLRRDYFIDGIVIKGNGIGQSMGFPTMNIATENRILPLGVFETQVKIRGKIYRSVTNIGYNPTFNRNRRSIEVHALDFKADVYQEKVRIFFLRKIRDEKKFRSKRALIKQIQKDIQAVHG